MLLYVLDYTYDRIAVIEEYESCIWTERFIVAGELSLVVPAINPNSDLLRPGVLLENEDAEDPMLIETAELKDGVITVTGTTVETFFDQRSVAPFVKTDSPGRILGSIVNDIQTEDGGRYGIYGVREGLVQADGSDVIVSTQKREKGYSLLVKLAQQYNVDMYIRRVFNEDTGVYELAFNTRVGVDHTEDSPSGEVRFSPEDDNLIGINEVYTAVNGMLMVVVQVPVRFAAPGGFAEDLGAVVINADDATYDDVYTYHTHVDTIGWNSPFDTRIIEPDSEVLTNDYLSRRLHIYFPGYTADDWYSRSDSVKQTVLQHEMVRMGKATFRRNQGNQTKAIDGEVAQSDLVFGRDYRLGDVVVVTASLEEGDQRNAVVTEYIRTADASGKRAYPTFSQPAVTAPYDDNPADVQVETKQILGDGDHTFSINGLLPSDLQTLSPHVVRVLSGQTKKLVSIYQVGPRAGTCNLVFQHNGSDITESDLPITLNDYDEITVDPTDHDEDAAYVSGCFSIEVT